MLEAKESSRTPGSRRFPTAAEGRHATPACCRGSAFVAECKDLFSLRAPGSSMPRRNLPRSRDENWRIEELPRPAQPQLEQPAHEWRQLGPRTRLGRLADRLRVGRI